MFSDYALILAQLIFTIILIFCILLAELEISLFTSFLMRNARTDSGMVYILN